MEYFLNELENIGMERGDKKSKQMSHCAVLLNGEEKPQNVNMRFVIYSCVGEILEKQPKSIESNLTNALQNLFTSSNLKIIKKIKENYHGPISEKNNTHTPRDFLLYLVKKYRQDNPVNENTGKIKPSFFKKCFLDI